jgi:hypothetical protein
MNQITTLLRHTVKSPLRKGDLGGFAVEFTSEIPPAPFAEGGITTKQFLGQSARRSSFNIIRKYL